MSTLAANSINQEKDACLGPLNANSSVHINLKKCIDCPSLCVSCIKNFCGMTNADIEENNYNVIYVASGEVTLFFPYTQIEKQLGANQLMLIPNETKFVLKSGNVFAASCVVAPLEAGQVPSACLYQSSH
ncbi:MAG: hypothetical protein H6Q72_1201 [Firmicutes bacterium]|nr:hypothetical protein [Bacillota bacterium]